MNEKPVEEMKVFSAGGHQVILVPQGRGEELRHHLLVAHGIRSKVSPAETAHERVEVNGETDVETVQAIVNQWRRSGLG